jgi:hypothetical protein
MNLRGEEKAKWIVVQDVVKRLVSNDYILFPNSQMWKMFYKLLKYGKNVRNANGRECELSWPAPLSDVSLKDLDDDPSEDSHAVFPGDRCLEISAAQILWRVINSENDQLHFPCALDVDLHPNLRKRTLSSILIWDKLSGSKSLTVPETS